MTPGDRPLAETTPTKSTLAFRSGLALIVASHAVYPVYGALPFLGLSPAEIAGVAAGSSLASWGIFSLGVALAGKDALPHLRRAVRRTLRRWRRRR
jgi:hypothetical protein